MTERELFLQALEINDPVERAAFLEKACQDQPDKRVQVDQLLKAHEQAGAFLAQPHAAAGATQATAGYVSRSSLAEKPGMLVAGKYKLLQCIGEGGMGSVWMADQLEPVKRRVAVKLIRTERDNSRIILSRFEAERQAIALMDHPNIAKLLDAGTTEGEPDGLSRSARPYFVMELVKGVPLTEFCDEHKLSIPERLTLFMQICSAVQHAHQKGIIHRDLKPTNILVEMHDDKPVPKVIDFGLAKAMSGQPLTEHTLFTAFGTVAGTPLYMAPEQAKFNAIDIDTRADIYALGVILYELLTGSTPIERAALKKAALDEIMRLIRESEPPTPSKRISTTASKPSVAANRRTEATKLGRFVKGELDWIVMKALAKERERRYETANGLAKDIERFLNHEPVHAGPPSASYRLRKFVERNRVQVIAASFVLLALLAGIAGTTLGLIRATEAAAAERHAREQEAEQRANAEKARDRTRQVLDAMTSSITKDSLASQKEISEDQKKFLNEVLSYYQELAADKANDEASRAQSAAAAYRVGMIEDRLGRPEQALAAFQMARDGYAKLMVDFPDTTANRLELARNQNNVGKHLAALGKASEAEEEYCRALATLEKLTTDFPAVADYRRVLAIGHDNLGILLQNLGKESSAEKEYQVSIAMLERLTADFPAVPEYGELLARSHFALGALLHKFQGLAKCSDAEEHYRKAISIQERLAAHFPTMSDCRFDLACSHSNLGRLFGDQGKHSEGEVEYRRALAIYAKLIADFPAVPDYRMGVALTHGSLGGLLANVGKRAEADEEYRGGIAAFQKLATDFPSVPDYKWKLASTRLNLGDLLVALMRNSEAEEEYRKALLIQEKLVTDFPAMPDYRLELSTIHNSLGNLLKNLEKKPEAEEQYRKALAIRAKLVTDFPKASEYQRWLAWSHQSLADLLGALKRQPEADEEYGQALIIRKKLVSDFPATPQYQTELSAMYWARAVSRMNAGQVTEALAEVAELTKSSNWSAGSWYNFACVYAIASGKNVQKKQEYADRAMELLSKAVKAGYKNAAHMKEDSDLASLRQRDDFKRLLTDLTASEKTGKKP
jgi:serine/threonine protein kinase